MNKSFLKETVKGFVLSIYKMLNKNCGQCYMASTAYTLFTATEKPTLTIFVITEKASGVTENASILRLIRVC